MTPAKKIIFKNLENIDRYERLVLASAGEVEVCSPELVKNLILRKETWTI